MKNLKECVNCYAPIDIAKHSYVHSPNSDRYRHLGCYTAILMKEVQKGVTEALYEHHEEQCVIDGLERD